MKPEIIEQDALLWRGLHWLLALLIPILVLSLMGCRRAEEDPEDLGPEVDPRAVQAVLDEATKGNTYSNGAKDQYTYYEENISAQGGVYQDRGSVLVYVKDRQDDPNDTTRIKFTMYYERRDLKEDGTFETVKSDEVFFWPKDKVTGDAETAGLPILTQALNTTKIRSMVRASARPDQPIRETYHRFEVKRGDVYPVPDAVKARTDCGGLAGCKYNALFIKLDQVRWYSDTDYDKFHYDLIYNKTTPFLFNLKNETMGGLLVLGCISTYVPYEGRKVYVRDCIQLKDFQK